MSSSILNMKVILKVTTSTSRKLLFSIIWHLLDQFYIFKGHFVHYISDNVNVLEATLNKKKHLPLHTYDYMVQLHREVKAGQMASASWDQELSSMTHMSCKHLIMLSCQMAIDRPSQSFDIGKIH